MNFLEASVAEISDDGVRVQLTLSGEYVLTHRSGANLQVGQPVTLGIRPEHLAQVDADTGPAGDSVLNRTLSLVERLGEQTYLHCHDTDGGQAGGSLMAKIQGNSTAQPDDHIRMSVPAQHCHLFTADGRAVTLLQSLPRRTYE